MGKVPYSVIQNLYAEEATVFGNKYLKSNV